MTQNYFNILLKLHLFFSHQPDESVLLIARLPLTLEIESSKPGVGQLGCTVANGRLKSNVEFHARRR